MTTLTEMARSGDPPTLRHVLPFFVGLVLFAALALFNEYRGFELWRNYALSGVILGGASTYVIWRNDVRLPHYIQWVIVAGLVLHYGGGSLGSPDKFHMGLFGFHGVNGAYHVISWWDHLTHSVGIGAGTMGIAYVLEVYQYRRRLEWPAWLVWAIAVVSGLAAGVGVELYEYLGKTWFQTIDQGGYVNTMQDLHYNLLGAVLGGGLAVTLNRTRFRKRIENHWGKRGRLPDTYASQMLPPSMTGLLGFVTIPAAAALYLATWYLFRDIPKDDSVLYDPALSVLTWATAVAAVLGPLASIIHTRLQRGRQVPADSGSAPEASRQTNTPEGALEDR